MFTTSRLALDVAQGVDAVSAGPADFAQAFGVLDGAVLYQQGTLVSRPAASSLPSGVVFYATDTLQWFWNNGSAWVQVPVYGSGTDAAKPSASVATGELFVASDTGSLYLSNGTSWLRVALVGSGTAAGIPAAGTLGRSYHATDTGQWWLDDGAAWGVLSVLRTPRAGASSLTAKPGDWIQVNGGNVIALPAPSANAVVAFTAAVVTGSSPATVTGTNIFGPGLSAASSFLLGTAGTYAVLRSDGTNWWIVSGGEDTGWVPLSLRSGVGALDLYTPAARKINGRVLLQGGLINNGASLPASTVLAAVPTVCQPSGTNVAALNTFPYLASTGVVGVRVTVAGTSAGVPGQISMNQNFPGASELVLNGCSYSLS